jgi:PTH1 family peptidyl-tRNA hydrolase
MAALAEHMQAVLGLGNPGDAYRGTRHNVGFEALDRVAAATEIAFKRSWRLKAHSCTMRVSGREVRLVKPQTFMNRSGQTAALLRRRGVAPERMLVVVDDVELPAGRIRIRLSGGAGGHNGLKSLRAELGTDAFPRLRIGVGPKPQGMELTPFVLGRFHPEQRADVDAGLERAAAAIRCALEEGLEAAMNRYNAEPGESGSGSRRNRKE